MGAGADGGVSALSMCSFFLLEKLLPTRENMADTGFFLLFDLAPVDVEASADGALMLVMEGVEGSVGRLLVLILAPSIR